jgi:pimeloyl-ACP methyl ester carboxylesterase
MTTAAQTRMVQTADGRELCVDVVGDPGGPAIFLCSGTPNSRLLFRVWTDDALSRGASLIGYDRPGYGRSTPQPGHSVADAAGDVRAIASALGVERIAVWGFSGGGPYALACAALLPDLVCASAAVCSVAPWDAPGLDYFSGMGEENVEGIKRYLEDPEENRKRGAELRKQMLQATPEQIAEVWKTLLSDVDRGALERGFADFVAESVRDGLAPGDQGWWDDGVAHLSPWGFELDSIRIPVKIWHGAHDRFVPFQHGRWLAEHIPAAEAALSDSEGHLSLLVDRVGDIHSWLLEHM